MCLIETGEITVTTDHLEHQWREMDSFIKSYQNDAHIDQYIDQYIYFKNHNFANIRDGKIMILELSNKTVTI